MYVFFIKDNELLEKYNEIWKKVTSSFKKRFDSESEFNEKYQKIKTKSYNGKSTQSYTIVKYQKKVAVYFSISNID